MSADQGRLARVAIDVWTPEREAEAARLVDAVRAAADAHTRAADARDDGIRAMLAEGVPVSTVAGAFGFSRERIYQIRDRRR